MNELEYRLYGIPNLNTANNCFNITIIKFWRDDWGRKKVKRFNHRLQFEFIESESNEYIRTFHQSFVALDDPIINSMRHILERKNDAH